MSMTLSEELKWRGFVNQTTLPNISALDTQEFTFYWGVDPSAPSMTIGNLAAAMMVRKFISYGHKPFLLIGGATGMIGDPDGKAEERALKSPQEIDGNKKAIVEQYRTIFKGMNFKVVDNYDWFKGLGYLDFLRDVGKHVPMRQMLNRDFVQQRVREGGAGISYAEFSYALIQGYDFLHLFQKHGVNLQVAASDQWGNSIAGVDLIRRITGGEAHVWTTPLVVNNATGKKFGKTEEGAIWLDPQLTSVYKFYQFWLNVDDEGAEDYLKIYTELNKEEIDQVMQQFTADKAGRIAQKTLAYEVTRLVHGQSRVEAVKKISEVLFGQDDFKSLGKGEVEILKQELVLAKTKGDFAEDLVNTGLASSKSEARNFIQAGAVSVNGIKVTTENENPLSKGLNLIKRGKNSFVLLEQ